MSEGQKTDTGQDGSKASKGSPAVQGGHLKSPSVLGQFQINTMLGATNTVKLL
jgi:hypothetical protein